MRKQIILLLAVFLPLFAFDMNADEKRTKKNPFGSPTPDVRGERNGYSD